MTTAITVLTLFPEVLDTVLKSSLIGKALKKGFFQLNILNPRDFSLDKHRTVDDSPYGGGEGMVMRADVLAAAWEKAKEFAPGLPIKTIYLSPQGSLLTHAKSLELSREDNTHFILVCGHYEGIDERFIEACVDEELSIGDYVLTGGELPALVLIDSVIRLKAGVLGNSDSALKDSLSDGFLKYPQYTRPPEFRGKMVPEILLSGNHEAIKAHREKLSREVTAKKRPDLLQKKTVQK